jgi:hypothetical protein
VDPQREQAEDHRGHADAEEGHRGQQIGGAAIDQRPRRAAPGPLGGHAEPAERVIAQPAGAGAAGRADRRGQGQDQRHDPREPAVEDPPRLEEATRDRAARHRRARIDRVGRHRPERLEAGMVERAAGPRDDAGVGRRGHRADRAAPSPIAAVGGGSWPGW